MEAFDECSRQPYMGVWNIEVGMDGPTMNNRPVTLLSVMLFLLIVGSSGFVGMRSSPAEAFGSDGFPMSVVDGFGRNVTIPRVPQRVVSLSPSSTEVLFGIGAGSRVVGVTRYCDYPPEVLVRVGDGSLKVVVALQIRTLRLLFRLSRI